jgi:predicted glycoside hydrolase/deacetylase ChbG (UPF0249 family)
VQITDGRRRVLVVSAPGYGGSERAARSVLTAHRRGIVTSTSVRATGAAFARTAPWLRDAPRLGVGACLVAVGDDAPLLSSAEIPSLVDRRGRLRGTWRQLAPVVGGGRVDPDDLRREFAAQLERIADEDLVVDHLDAGLDLHRWPAVGRVLVQLADRHGVPALRVPSSWWARGLERRCRAHGLAHPGVSAGPEDGGRHDLPSVIRALHHLAASGEATVELTSSLATVGDDAPSEGELTALTSGTVRHAVDEYGFVLGRFADLVPDRSPARHPGPAAASG